MANFLVTGGAGFIGSHIVEYLVNQKRHFVRVLDDFSSGRLENLSFAQRLSRSSFEVIHGDIRDKKICEKACRGIDYVLHQAALRSVPKSVEMPQLYNEVNIQGTLFMLEAAVKNQIKRFVFASSSSIYGEASKFPQKEADSPELISPYALTKLTGEYTCRIFSKHFGLETVCLRYFNVFGPRQALDDEYAVVVPKFIHCLLKDQKPPVYGNGKQSRDFTYIENVVAANIRAATFATGLKHVIFNVASGQNHSVLELLKILNKILHKNILPDFKPPRPGDVFKTLADTGKIKQVLGFSIPVGFEEGLQKTADFFKSC